MKLWLLRPRDDLVTSPWHPWYDKAFGFVVRAETEDAARCVASAECGDEKPNAWLDEKFSTCIPLEASGDCEIVVRDFAAA